MLGDGSINDCIIALFTLLSSLIYTAIIYNLMPQGLRKLADSIFNSKIRYGLQMCGKIRWQNSDTTPKLMKDLQLAQNKMLRLLNGSRISDKISTSALLSKFNMLSVNQINAQIKLSEMWKAVNDNCHPFALRKRVAGENVRSMRSITNDILPDQSFSELSKNTFINDGIKAWNHAPSKIKECKSFTSAKAEICFISILLCVCVCVCVCVYVKTVV